MIRTLAAAAAALALLTACGGEGSPTTGPTPTVPATPTPAPGPDVPGFVGQLKTYGLTVEHLETAAGGDYEPGDVEKVVRRARNACPAYSPDLGEDQRVAGLADRFGIPTDEARLVYSATVLHLCPEGTTP